MKTMEENMSYTDVQTISKYLEYIVGLLVVNFVNPFIYALIFNIDPMKEYGWFLANFHAAALPANWVFSLFNDSILLKAPIHTPAYNIFWWVGVSCIIWQLLMLLLALISLARVIVRNNRTR